MWAGQETLNDCGEDSTYLQGLTSELCQSDEQKLRIAGQRDLPCLTELPDTVGGCGQRGHLRVKSVRKSSQEGQNRAHWWYATCYLAGDGELKDSSKSVIWVCTYFRRFCLADL